MGVYYEGRIDVGYSRALTEQEYAGWLDAIRRGHTDREPCANSKHDGALLDPDTGRCEHYDDTPGAAGYCHGSSDRYDPEGWAIDDDTWGDIGQLEHGAEGFTISAGGKVYDIPDACSFFVASLPEDVMAEGSGYFTADSEPWGLIVRGREVREGWGEPVVEGDPAPAGTVVWLLAHLNLVDGDVAHRIYSDEKEAREHFAGEREEHEESTFSTWPEHKAPWVDHFVADEECVTFLDRVEVS